MPLWRRQSDERCQPVAMQAGAAHPACAHSTAAAHAVLDPFWPVAPPAPAKNSQALLVQSMILCINHSQGCACFHMLHAFTCCMQAFVAHLCHPSCHRKPHAVLCLARQGAQAARSKAQPACERYSTGCWQKGLLDTP